MPQKMTKHEWENVYKIHNSILRKCKHCPAEVFKGHSTGKVEYFLNGIQQNEEPLCLTNKISINEDKLNLLS